MPTQLPERLDSPFSINLGRFARLAQLTRLLGQIIDKLRRNTPNDDAASQETIQLCATLMALVRVYEFEGK